MLSRAAVKTPLGQLVELGEGRKVLDLSLAAQARERGVAVEPDVLQFVFGHRRWVGKEGFG